MPVTSNYREHRENRMVGILRRTAIFDELVKRFVAGQLRAFQPLIRSLHNRRTTA
jgi:hypothetical protein